MRFHGDLPASPASTSSDRPGVGPFPRRPFRFAALDVETANHDRSSICQIGVACVRADDSIETWVTYVDPQKSNWVYTGLHGTNNSALSGAPTFDEVLPTLVDALSSLTVYQHSGFDRSAIRAACAAIGRSEPGWDWQDSVTVARRTWPELKGNGGHGLASLKRRLGLFFDHHDAGEDARAAAEVVLHAERAKASVTSSIPVEADVDTVELPRGSVGSARGPQCQCPGRPRGSERAD